MIKLIGYGNPGRCDDGLGPAFASGMAALGLSGLEVRTDYQLTVDHALWVADARQVIFADAAMDAPDGFHFNRIKPAGEGALSSHSLSPAAVLALAKTLYGAEPEAFILAITGYAFGKVHEGLSPRARTNLQDAEGFFQGWLSDRTPADARAAE